MWHLLLAGVALLVLVDATSLSIGAAPSQAGQPPRSGEYWCPDAMGGKNSSITGVGKKVVKMHGYCYYLGHAGESCSKTCGHEIGGTCNAAGIEYVANTKKCQFTLKAFSANETSGIGFTDDIGEDTNTDRTGCTFVSQAFNRFANKEDEGRVEVFRKDDKYPLCSAIPQDTNGINNHRLCACTVEFGKLTMFTKSVGHCAPAGVGHVGRQSGNSSSGANSSNGTNSSSGANSSNGTNSPSGTNLSSGTPGSLHLKTLVLNNEKECEDECARLPACGAFAFIDPWDQHPRQCIFYKHHADGLAGSGSNKYVKCSVKTRYLNTMGRCTKHGGRQVEQTSNACVGTQCTLAECKAACSADPACEAFEVPRNFTSGRDCTFYTAGHTGNSVDPAWNCYTQATGGVSYRT